MPRGNKSQEILRKKHKIKRNKHGLIKDESRQIQEHCSIDGINQQNAPIHYRVQTAATSAFITLILGYLGYSLFAANK